MMGNYSPKDHCVMIGDRLYGFFCANWQAECFSKSTHLFVDICYIKKNSELPGLLNIVAPCSELKCYVPMYWIFVNKQDGTAIAFVVETAFRNIQAHYPQFNMGSNIEQLMVDFSDAKENGLRAVLGNDLINKVIRGCKFHFMQSTEKVAMLVTETDMQKQMFIHLARKIPDCTDQEVVHLILSILGEEKRPSEAQHIITDVKLKDSSLLMDNKAWVGASTWVEWWLRSNHLRKLSLAFSEISADVWHSSQATNNPVESINRVSKTQSLCSTSFLKAGVMYFC